MVLATTEAAYAVQRDPGRVPNASAASGVPPAPRTDQRGDKPEPAGAGPQAKATGKAHTVGGRSADATSRTAPAKKHATARRKTPTLSPVQQALQHNMSLADNLRVRLPEGTDPMVASAGFRNLGQFVAAVNVSRTLGIPFAKLKTRMVDDGMTLGLAIQDARPKSDYRSDAQRAERDATLLIGSTEAQEASLRAKPRP
jgi:hypothetical protein